MSDHKAKSSNQDYMRMRATIQSLLKDGTMVENLQAQTSLTRHFLYNLNNDD